MRFLWDSVCAGLGILGGAAVVLEPWLVHSFFNLQIGVGLLALLTPFHLHDIRRLPLSAIQTLGLVVLATGGEWWHVLAVLVVGVCWNGGLALVHVLPRLRISVQEEQV